MRALLRVVLLTCVAVACGGGGEPPTQPLNGGGGGGGGGGAGGGGTGSPGLTASVSVSDFTFSPGTVNILKGGTVTWNWVGGDGYGQPTAHNVSFTNGTGSGDETTGTFQKVFPDAGTFTYECTHHRPNMKGTVVVH